MKINPEFVNINISKSKSPPLAEKIVFDWLKEIDVSEKGLPDPVAYHSLAIPRHSTQIEGEAFASLFFTERS